MLDCHFLKVSKREGGEGEVPSDRQFQQGVPAVLSLHLCKAVRLLLGTVVLMLSTYIYHLALYHDNFHCDARFSLNNLNNTVFNQH